jgi:metal-responsive CopG/Arc/MetJ family transcriptional regulator
MPRKQEIKVYLPTILVGELEGRRRMGTRSLFIQQAITDKLRRMESATLQDFNPVAMLCYCRDLYSDKPMVHDLLQLIVNEVNK